MHTRALVSIAAMACLAHAQAFAADAAAPREPMQAISAKQPPVPVAKPAVPIADTAKVIADGEGKPGELPHARSVRPTATFPAAATPKAHGAPECSWTGERVIHTLLRSEADAASQFTGFYTMFGCPTAHITEAFSCVVGWQGDPSRSDPDRIKDCWKDPSLKEAAAPAATAEAGKETAKSGPGSPDDKPPPKKE